jgi:hypothetical protein
MIDLAAIPKERLALLDTATLYSGGHDGTGGPDCQHCARELLHEIVTGVHRDATPPGCSVFLSILPGINDGPWRDDAHRTQVMRPYLRKMLLLDPAKDEQRLFAVIDHVYRKIMPEICDALKLDKHGSALRDLPAVIDVASTRKATKIFVPAIEAARARDRDLDRALARDLDRARALALALARALALALARARALALPRALALDLDLDLARALALDLARARARALALALDLDLARALALALALDLDLARALAESWERGVTALLDVICEI